MTMSETDQLLKQLFQEIKDVKLNMATKQDLESMATKQDLESITARMDTMNEKLDRLSDKVTAQHIENMNSDNLLLNEIRSIREKVVFVNRKVADAELEIHSLKNNQ
jgi:hypothetical protein